MDETLAFTPYGTPESPRVAVSGEARLEVEPEFARISVTVLARGTDRRGALDDLSRRNAAVLDLIKGYGDAVEKLETGALSISPELGRHGRSERVRAYHGRVHLTAELTDFTALGELTTRLADLELTRVDGPWWELRPDSPAYSEARRMAVHEAVQRARAYADALGTRLDALVELADVGAEPPGLYRDAMPQMKAMAFGGASAGGAAAPPPPPRPPRQTGSAPPPAPLPPPPPQL
ncbi:SIMPL domain-containing protein [Streptomyces sp. N35]|uniref:SIMPL domain-containing protein n=1 Tax=Streptomyces sp. N35 TaxID=2795730 RepID=UPI0018F4FE1E|nr:SIMPL domain-containing protein [Streptomyces sp. N35]